MITRFGLIGAGGFSREVLPLIRDQLANSFAHGEYEIYLVDKEASPTSLIQGHRLISESEFYDLPGRKLFNVSVANSKTREQICRNAQAHGCEPLTVVSRWAQNLADNRIEDGAIICGFSTITASAKIGKFFHSNIYSYVAHDCQIGDFVTLAPRVSCNGNVVIGDHAYIGTGAILKQGTPDKPLVIGEGAIVGMGAIVTKDVAPGATVVGNPARPLERK